jgi:hypothetical protein
MNEAIRSRLRMAVDSLCDFGAHSDLWIEGTRTDPEEATFEDVVLFVLDELATTRPEELLGHILQDTEELSAFLNLVSALNSLIPALDKNTSFESALSAGPQWQACRDASCRLRLLLD